MSIEEHVRVETVLLMTLDCEGFEMYQRLSRLLVEQPDCGMLQAESARGSSVVSQRSLRSETRHTRFLRAFEFQICCFVYMIRNFADSANRRLGQRELRQLRNLLSG